MKFSYNFIQKFVNKKLPSAEKLAELLTMHSFEVEGIEKKGDDYIFDIDILPNRAHDAASHIGIAREVAALTGSKLKLWNKIITSKGLTLAVKNQDIEVNIQNTALCPRYMAAVIKGVEVKSSPKWLKEQLKNLGLNSINNLVDAANYAMLATGQPLHIFDLDKMGGLTPLGNGSRGSDPPLKKIIVRQAKKGEIVETLDGEAYILDNNMLVIADGNPPAGRALAIAGIKGGIGAEVTPKTKNIVIESANFDPINIRKTSRNLGLHTDASWRFEHETPLSLAQDGIDYLLGLVKELSGGKAEKEIIDIYPKQQSAKIIGISPQKATSVLGISVSATKIKKILISLGFKTHKENDMIHVEVPPFRLDIEREEDLIEEVGRILGYESIEPKMPRAALYPPRRNIKTYWLKQINRHLAASGFNQVHNYVFVSEDIFSVWGFKKNQIWELKNPANDELKYMRPSLAPLAVKTAHKNLKFYNEVQFFEVGEVFCIHGQTTKSADEYWDGKGMSYEEPRLSLSIASKKENKKYFYILKGEIELLFESLGISDIWFDDFMNPQEQKKVPYLHSGRRAQIKVADKILGYMGQIHPAVADEENLKGALFTADIDLSMLINLAEEEEIYAPVSNYPQIIRDVSLSISTGVKAEEVISTINVAGGVLLRDVDMFDYYENPATDEESSELNSMAFHLIFQAEDRTLKSEEIDKIMKKIVKEINNKNWEIR